MPTSSFDAARKTALQAVKGFADVGGKTVQGYHGLKSMYYNDEAKQHERLADMGDEIKNRKSFIKTPDNWATRKALEHSNNREKISKDLKESKDYHDDKHAEMGQRRDDLKKEAGSTGAAVSRVAHALNPVDTLADIGEAKKATAGIPGAIGGTVANLIPGVKLVRKAKTIAAPLISSTLKRYAVKKAVGEGVEETTRKLSDTFNAARAEARSSK